MKPNPIFPITVLNSRTVYGTDICGRKYTVCCIDVRESSGQIISLFSHNNTAFMLIGNPLSDKELENFAKTGKLPSQARPETVEKTLGANIFNFSQIDPFLRFVEMSEELDFQWPKGTTAADWERVMDINYTPKEGDFVVSNYNVGFCGILKTNDFKYVPPGSYNIYRRKKTPEIKWPEGTTAKDWERVTNGFYIPKAGDLQVWVDDGECSILSGLDKYFRPVSWYESPKNERGG